jgi:hypothetical protein
MRFLSVLSKASIAYGIPNKFQSDLLARIESKIYTLKFFKYHDLRLQEHLECPRAKG